MESGRFTGVFRNAPFDKRSVLRGLRGCSPHFYMTPRTVRRKGGFGELSVGEMAGADMSGPGIDGMSGRDFFYFFPVDRFFY